MPGSASSSAGTIPSLASTWTIVSMRTVRKPWAQGIVERFSDTFTEISPTGQGLKIWAKGDLPANVAGVRVGDGQIEMYDHARYFTVTGRVFNGAPLEVEHHAADLLLLHERLTKTAHKSRWPLHPLEGGRIPYGQQHNTLVSIVGTLRARRVCDEAIEACLQIVNERQCERPGPADAHQPARAEFAEMGSNSMPPSPAAAEWLPDLTAASVPPTQAKTIASGMPEIRVNGRELRDVSAEALRGGLRLAR
jgi:hypothetical protein